jgi:hypothetical protein
MSYRQACHTATSDPEGIIRTWVCIRTVLPITITTSVKMAPKKLPGKPRSPTPSPYHHMTPYMVEMVPWSIFGRKLAAPHHSGTSHKWQQMTRNIKQFYANGLMVLNLLLYTSCLCGIVLACMHVVNKFPCIGPVNTSPCKMPKPDPERIKLFSCPTR